jgi:hypothetical protein
MKKIKRACALALASAMVLGMFSMTAAADDENKTSGSSYSVTQNTTSNTTNPITGITVTKAVTAKAGVTLPNETFYIQMVPATVAEDEVVGATTGEDGKKTGGTPVEAGPALKNNVLEFNFSSANKTTTGKTSESADFDITQFASTGFDHAGVYRYNIYEATKNEDGTYSQVIDPNDGKTYYVENDYKVYDVDLYVSTDTTNNKYVVTSVAVTEEGNTEKPTSITFTNQINCANITITKAIDGDPYKAGEAFDFYIMIPEEGDTITLTERDTVQAQVFEGDTAVSEIMTLAVKGANINAAVTEGTHFTLKNGQTLKITAPVSMIYKVGEKDYSSEDYTTTVTYESSGTANKKNDADGTLFEEAQTDGTKYNCVRGTTETTVNSVMFTNSREAAKPDTGINLDFIPYMLVLVLAAAGGAVLAYKKRRMVR